MTFWRHGKAAALFCAILFLAGGCAIPHQVSLSDRCVQAMRAAFPSARIKITGSEAKARGVTTVTAKISGVRTDLAKNALFPRHLAVFCRFEDGILTAFRWTRGPLR